ncbi:Protein Asterix [Tetrabaena socialis]|uniref:Protein Asterix n=1 Tax=Tetrabaena socialis TaxID=47790 RepID=A0A2J7ZXB5_9CHLO|nr:Protein Asterix [Tetrabaena socialis]|eukprot:PNH04909.1 Protein Asterix [Tetrabaena socialis]
MSQSLGGDPRRPSEVVPFKRPSPDPDRIEVLSMSGMILGLIGVMAKVRILSFLSLAFIASAFIQRTPDTDMKQLFLSTTFAMSGLFFARFQPQPGHAANSTAAVPPAGAAIPGGPAAARM